MLVNLDAHEVSIHYEQTNSQNFNLNFFVSINDKLAFTVGFLHFLLFYIYICTKKCSMNWHQEIFDNQLVLLAFFAQEMDSSNFIKYIDASVLISEFQMHEIYKGQKYGNILIDCRRL